MERFTTRLVRQIARHAFNTQLTHAIANLDDRIKNADQYVAN